MSASATGLTVSLFEDFTKPATPPFVGAISATPNARLRVIAAQQQPTLPSLAATTGAQAVDATTITQPTSTT